MKNKLACVLMAAGNSERFGENKLYKTLNGKSLIDIALDRIPEDQFNKIIVVSQYENILKKASDRGYIAITNDNPDVGQSYSVRLSVRKCSECDAILFLVSDQPHLKKESIIELIKLHEEYPDYIVGMEGQTFKGSPCIFPSKYFDDLKRLIGDTGGRPIIKENLDNFKTLKVDDNELFDIDTIDDYKKIKESEKE